MPAPIPTELHGLMDTTSKMLHRVLNPQGSEGIGFVMVAFHQDDLSDRMHIFTNATNETVIEALRALVTKLENGRTAQNVVEFPPKRA